MKGNNMFELRTYTVRTSEALEQYATIHWDRHLTSLAKFGITTHGVWTDESGDAHRLLALVSYQEGADPAQTTRDYMSSSEFAADMEGFDVQNFVSVESTILTPTASSPLR